MRGGRWGGQCVGTLSTARKSKPEATESQVHTQQPDLHAERCEGWGAGGAVTSEDGGLEAEDALRHEGLSSVSVPSATHPNASSTPWRV